MAAENKPQANNTNNKKRKQRFLSHNKPVKKGSYPLHPGVQGFFLTCDGGRERQATHEAINVIDTFYEELINGDGLNTKSMVAPTKPLNKVIKFSDSDSSSEEEDDKSEPHEVPSEPQDEEGATNDNQTSEKDETSVKKQRLDTDASQCENTVSDETEEKPVQENDKTEEKPVQENDKTEEKPVQEKSIIEEKPVQEKSVIEEKPVQKKDKTAEKSIDQLIEDEIKELKDRNKRRFASLDSGCNGCVFVKMHKKDGEPGPVEIVQHMMTSLASTKKHMSRFILRVLPVEVTCYASEEEISKAIKPLISQYFPAEAANPLKFAVLYEARANTGIDRMKIINAVAKSVPEPHKVDLTNPDKTIIVQIAKTLCMIGVVEKYKELSKYNLRQLTSPQP